MSKISEGFFNSRIGTGLKEAFGGFWILLSEGDNVENGNAQILDEENPELNKTLASVDTFGKRTVDDYSQSFGASIKEESFSPKAKVSSEKALEMKKKKENKDKERISKEVNEKGQRIK